MNFIKIVLSNLRHRLFRKKIILSGANHSVQKNIAAFMKLNPAGGSSFHVPAAGKIITDALIEKYGIQEPEQPKKIVVTKSWNEGN